MIEQTLVIETSLPSETNQLPTEQKAKRKRYVKRCCCKQCGKPKHYICLEHHNYKKTGIKRLLNRIRYYSKKFFFNLAGRLRLVE